MKKEVKTIKEVYAIAETLPEEKYAIDIYQTETGYVIQWIERKMFTSHDNKEYPDEVWITKENEMLLVQDISDDHCKNILRMLIRNDRELRARIHETMAALGEWVENMESDDSLLDNNISPNRVLH